MISGWIQSSAGGILRTIIVFSVTRRKTVFSRDFCCLSAIFVVSCSDFLTRFQNSVDWNMLSPFQMLENEGLNLSQKRRVLLHMMRCRGRLTQIPAPEILMKWLIKVNGLKQNHLHAIAISAFQCRFLSSEGVGFHVARKESRGC